MSERKKITARDAYIMVEALTFTIEALNKSRGRERAGVLFDPAIGHERMMGCRKWVSNL
jgi:hypothetical protein